MIDPRIISNGMLALAGGPLLPFGNLHTCTRFALAIGAVKYVVAASCSTCSVFVSAFATNAHSASCFTEAQATGGSAVCQFPPSRQAISPMQHGCLIPANSKCALLSRHSQPSPRRSCIRTLFADAIGKVANIVETARANLASTLSTRASGERAADFGADACEPTPAVDVTAL